MSLPADSCTIGTRFVRTPDSSRMVSACLAVNCFSKKPINYPFQNINITSNSSNSSNSSNKPTRREKRAEKIFTYGLLKPGMDGMNESINVS